MNKPETQSGGSLKPVGSAPSEDWWAIIYEDADRRMELFTDEATARATLKERLDAWNCHLFHRVPNAKLTDAGTKTP